MTIGRVNFRRPCKAHAIVGDRDMQPIVLVGKGEVRPACLGMVADVAPGLLYDPEQRRAGLAPSLVPIILIPGPWYVWKV